MTKRGTIVNEGWKGPGRRDRIIEPLTPRDDALNLDPSHKGHFEWWYFDAHLEGGQTVVVFFHAANPNTASDPSFYVCGCKADRRAK